MRKEKNGRISPPFNSALDRMPEIFSSLFYVFIILTTLSLLLFDADVMLSDAAVRNLYLFPGALALIALALLLMSRQGRSQKPWFSERSFYLMLVLCFVLIYALQLVVASGIAMKTGWDVDRIRKSAEDIFFEGSMGVDKIYFSYYPNNIPMVYTMVIFYKIGNILHRNDPYVIVTALSCAFLCMSRYLSSPVALYAYNDAMIVSH